MSNIYDLNEEETIAMWLYYQAYNYRDLANKQCVQALEQVEKQFRQQGNRYDLP